MAKIVISYRRADSEAVTGRIRDRLVSHYGQESIFMDIDSIPFGIDFRDYIKEALAETDALIAVIGREWTGTIESGPSRIMEETDPVRIEVESALTRGIAVIPLLIDEATMPQPAQLPESLKNLAFRNAAHVDSGRDFHPHMDRLIRSMDRLLGRVQEQRTSESPAAGAPAAAAGFPTAPFPTAKPQSEPPQITEMARAPKRRWGIWISIGMGVSVLLAGVVSAALMYPFAGPRTQIAQGPTPTPAQPAAPTPSVQPSPAPTPVQPAVIAAPPPQCAGTKVAFEDNFSPPAAGWDDTSASRLFENGQMIIRLAANRLQTWLYRPLRFKNASACLRLRAPLAANKLDSVASGGLVFWATDYSNYYLAQIYLDGSFQVFRRLSGEWIRVVTRTKSEHIKSGLGATNELQVTTKDNSGTFYANGQKLVEFRGQPPDNGGAVGVHGEAESDRDAEWVFTGLTVVDEGSPAPRKPSAKATRFATSAGQCNPEKEAAFADDFKNKDAGWGDMTETAYYEGGVMVLKPQPNRTRTLLYLSLRYVNPTLCVNVRWPSNPAEGSDIGAAGAAFWGTNYSNFYQVSVYREGTFDVYRYVNGEWISIKKRTPTDAIDKDPSAVNQVKVQMVNNKATIHINNKQVIEVWGQPPPQGGAVGLFAQSDKERTNAWRFSDIVVVD